ncbi:touch insensitive larva B [Calliopsis andreniformis]|uniref:touch insensitive larva B n=1 Tax=Calliopsis andreniformis TaxID=337506 RepID=UPI003FCECA0E
MPRITLDLIRKRSEHNEGEITTLEEIALHQENIEKIELIDSTCRHLKILLLQNNLIVKIENLNKLKSLEYLNLALNNIEVIENLEGLESLRKLDLTVNFIGDLRGIEKLRCNENLEQLFLMGNPCADYEGYRKYTIAILTQLKELDGTVIERSERIKALQACAQIEGEIIRSYVKYRKTREAEIIDYRERIALEATQEDATQNEEEENEKFWKRTSRHTPEERVAIAERVLKQEEQKNKSNNEKNRLKPVYVPKFFSPEGKPYNVNQAKVPFKLNDEEYHDRIVLEISVYRYLDTQYVDINVQPDYIRVTIKGKVLQLTLPCEVSIENSTAKRNTINGRLVITMPRLSPLPIIKKRSSKPSTETKITQKKDLTEDQHRCSATMRRQYLEIGPPVKDLDFSRIVDCKKTTQVSVAKKYESSELEEDDWSNSEVPPLE